MTRPPIFVSHSAKEPEAEEALEALAARLDADGFEVLLDRERLRIGDFWRPGLRRWLDVCRGAVVLLSPSAFNSAHVLQEVVVLMQRASRSTAFRVAPVLTAGATRDDVRKNPWSVTQLSELQLPAWDAQVAGAISERFRPLLQAADAADASLELRVAQKLKEYVPDAIRQAGAWLGLGLAEWQLEAEDAGSVALARELLESRHRDQLKAVLSLGEVDPSRAVSVYHDVEPYGLMARERADAVRRRVRMRDRGRNLGLNSSDPATFELLVHRANFLWKMREVPRTWADAASEEVLEDVIDMVARALGYIDDDMPVDGVELNEELGEEPVFLLLPSPLPPLAVVEAIEAALGNLVLMFRCGTAEEARALRAGEVEYLPELAEGEEARLLADRQRATRRLRALAS